MKTKLLNLLAAVLLCVQQLLAAPMRQLANADRDKLQHHIAGVWIGLTGALLALGLGFPLLDAGIAALTAALAVGYIKEGLDWLENRMAVQAGRVATRGVEHADALATWAGSAPVGLPLILAGWLR